MTKLQIGNRHYKIASNWSELSPKKFLEIAAIRTMMPAPTTDHEILAMKIAFLLITSDLKQIGLDRIKRDHEEHLAEILKKVEWCIEVPVLRDNPFPKITRNDAFHLKRVALLGPIGLLETTTFAEFMAADEAFIQFHLNKERSSAWLLFSILWRPIRSDHVAFKKDPERYNGDLREPFNIERAQQRAKKYDGKLPAHYATAALLFFESIRYHQIVQHPRLKILFHGSESGSSSTSGWIDPLLKISNTKFGPFKETSEQHFFLILYEMANQMHEAKRRQEESEKLKRKNQKP
jgi:hypothetical protein